MENRGLTNNLEYKKYNDLSCSPETQHRFTGKKIKIKLKFLLISLQLKILTNSLGLLAKMKDTAENAAQKIQAKAESVGFKNVSGDISVGFHRKSSISSEEALLAAVVV